MNAISEREWTAQLLDLLRLYGYRTAHFRPAWTGRGWRTPVQGDGIGFPDIIAVRGGRIVALELKVGRAKLNPEQAVWLADLATAGAETRIARPEDFDELARWLR